MTKQDKTTEKALLATFKNGEPTEVFIMRILDPKDTPQRARRKRRA